MSWSLTSYASTFVSSYLLVVWKLYKLLVRKFIFGTHEIYRICSYRHPNSPVTVVQVLLRMPIEAVRFDSQMVYRLDRSLLYSSRLQVARRILEGVDCVDVKPTYKMIVESKFPEPAYTASAGSPVAVGEGEKRMLTRALTVIWEVNQLMHKINSKASTKYDSTIKAHEQKLLDLHKNLLGKPPTQRITKEWQVLGFQGNDPSTDFRGMGKLALDELHYISRVPAGKSTWNESGGDDGYSWAICGIQITAFQLQLMRSRKLHKLLLDWHFEQHSKGDASKSAQEAIEFMTERYFAMYAWMFEEYHVMWKVFLERKRDQFAQEGKKMIAVLLHNEFFTEYKSSIEQILLSGQVKLSAHTP